MPSPQAFQTASTCSSAAGGRRRLAKRRCWPRSNGATRCLRSEERAVLARLSVFASGFGLHAAEAVCAGGAVEDHDVLGLLTSLVDKSLVQVDPSCRPLPPPRDNASVRQHRPRSRRRHRGGPGPSSRPPHHAGAIHATDGQTSELCAALAVLEPDLDNLRSALDWSVQSEQFNACADLLGALGRLLRRFCGFGLRLGLAASGCWRPSLDPSAPGRPPVLCFRSTRQLGPTGLASPGMGADRTRSVSSGMTGPPLTVVHRSPTCKPGHSPTKR